LGVGKESRGMRNDENTCQSRSVMSTVSAAACARYERYKHEPVVWFQAQTLSRESTIRCLPFDPVAPIVPRLCHWHACVTARTHSSHCCQNVWRIAVRGLI
jgi:hypothetical protein